MLREKPKATIYDVAAKAGVAISTVSRVLNNSSDVSDATRAKVNAAIEALQFRPDRTAKSLAQKGVQTISVALPSFTTPFHNEFLKGVRQALRGSGFDLLLSDLGSTDPHATLLRFLERGAVDGLVLVGMPVDDTLAAELRALRAPVVLVGYASDGFDAYVWDDEAGAYAATKHLLKIGRRRIGMIRAHSESEFTSDRIAGYQRALAEAGIAFDATRIVRGETEKHAGFSEEAGYEALQALLAVHPDTDAVFASADVLAFGAWAAAKDAGLRVPEDLAIVGYDDVKVSRYIGLSSIDQSILEAGKTATERLLARVQGELRGVPAETVHLSPTLIVRGSSGSE